MKPGWKTSEYWLALVAQIVGAVLASGAVTNVIALQVLGVAASLLAGLGYTVSRTMVKSADAKASAIIAATKPPQNP